jgi:hypothetical protein
MKRVIAAAIMVAAAGAAHADDQWQSSFAGFEFDINGIRIDQNIETSLTAFNPDFRFKTGRWNDSQGEYVRDDVAWQAFSFGNISAVREEYRVTATPWHAGNVIHTVTRIVSIKPDDQKPTVASFVATAEAKYGEPIEHVREGIFGRRAMQMLYPVKDGQIADVPCFDMDQGWYGSAARSEQRLNSVEGYLAEIDAGKCDGVLSIWYTIDSGNEERISYYGGAMRDFRLELEAYIANEAEQEAATLARQQATPEGTPDL